ncbi:MAG: hypothetical protein KGL53_07300, partial [Elusimicrobia bacterium]|nr:hypothetical protein [Elusimicrobiota bacterium]
LNDGVYWDDWLLTTFLKDRSWGNIRALTVGRGVPTDFIYWKLLSLAPNSLLAGRVGVFACIVALGCLVYLLCRRSGFLSRAEALLAALITVTYPAFQTWVLLCTGNYVAYLTLFMAGALAALEAERARGAAHLALRAACLGLFFASFGLNSLLVSYFGVLALLVLERRRRTGRGLVAELYAFCRARLDYLALPFGYWLVKCLAFPAGGEYAGYNHLGFAGVRAAGSAVGFLRFAVYTPINEALRIGLAEPALLAGAWIGYRAYGTARPEPESPRRACAPAAALLAFGAGLAFLAALPYVLVGKRPSPAGWDTRHSLLLALPAALLLIGAARAASGRPEEAPTRPALALLALLCGLFAASTVRTYLELQARWAVDRAVIHQLSEKPADARYSTYWVDESSRPGPEAWRDETHRPYEWAGMLGAAWGGERRVGVDLADAHDRVMLSNLVHLKGLSGIPDWDPAGCQANLTVSAGPVNRRYWKVALKYLALRYLKPKDLPDFLDGLAAVDVRPVTAPGCVSLPLTAAR